MAAPQFTNYLAGGGGGAGDGSVSKAIGDVGGIMSNMMNVWNECGSTSPGANNAISQMTQPGENALQAFDPPGNKFSIAGA